jgi:hypothetical protein
LITLQINNWRYFFSIITFSSCLTAITFLRSSLIYSLTFRQVFLKEYIVYKINVITNNYSLLLFRLSRFLSSLTFTLLHYLVFSLTFQSSVQRFHYRCLDLPASTSSILLRWHCVYSHTCVYWFTASVCLRLHSVQLLDHFVWRHHFSHTYNL